MIRGALRLKFRAAGIGLGLSPRLSVKPLLRISCPRSLHISTRLQIATDNLPVGVEDKLELVAPEPKPRKDFTGSASIHVARVHKDTTDEEFRSAFAFLKGLDRAELIFNSGPLRDYKNTSSRGFGFLHFVDEESALAASKILEQDPVRLKGYETEINPYTTHTPNTIQKSHTLHISGLPLDLQYLEVAELLRSKSLDHRSIRFMANKELSFVGAINIIFNDNESADIARKALVGTTIGGIELRENDVKYGRSLWEEGPTTTLMIIGTPKDEDGARRLRNVLASLEGLTRYKTVKDMRSGQYKGITILDCVSIPEAWRLLEYLHRTYPAYRIAFIVDKLKYEQKLGEGRRQEFHRERGHERPRSYRRKEDSEDDYQERPTSYRKFRASNAEENQEGGSSRGRYY